MIIWFEIFNRGSRAGWSVYVAEMKQSFAAEERAFIDGANDHNSDPTGVYRVT